MTAKYINIADKQMQHRSLPCIEGKSTVHVCCNSGTSSSLVPPLGRTPGAQTGRPEEKKVNVDNANFRDLTSQSGLKQKLQVKHLPP